MGNKIIKWLLAILLTLAAIAANIIYFGITYYLIFIALNIGLKGLLIFCAGFFVGIIDYHVIKNLIIIYKKLIEDK